jgi:hypothetical protein
MKTEPIYSDSLVIITSEAIIFKRYYYPRCEPKRVMLSDIKSIVPKRPSLWNGKWRLHGTGTFTTWFPEDQNRPDRDRIFFVKQKRKWLKIAFTVEDSRRVEEILREKGLVA